ncbi:mitochondrial splicing system protein, partial [Spiromyces aspiralis]
AFENGKLDLTSLEGLADLINAETKAQRQQALRQAEGGLRKMYDGWRNELVHLMAKIEAVIDFSEEENIEDNVYNDVRIRIVQLRDSIKRHLDDDRRGEILRDGLKLSIIGPPNAGKSSFLNLLGQYLDTKRWILAAKQLLC